MLPALGGEHIFEDQPIGVCIKIPLFSTPIRKEKELFTPFVRFNRSFVRSFRFVSINGCTFTSKSPTGATTSCTTTFNLCTAHASCSFSSSPPALSTFFFQFSLAFLKMCSPLSAGNTFLKMPVSTSMLIAMTCKFVNIENVLSAEGRKHIFENALFDEHVDCHGLQTREH